MLSTPIPEILRRADALVAACSSRDPREAARHCGVEILLCPFRAQKGAYVIILRNRFIFLKEDLPPGMARVVLWHELGHDALHRGEAARSGGFREAGMFLRSENLLEHEANLFAAQALIADEEFLSLAGRGYDLRQMAASLDTDPNLIALKADALIARGHRLREQFPRDDFLKSSEKK